MSASAQQYEVNPSGAPLTVNVSTQLTGLVVQNGLNVVVTVTDGAGRLVAAVAPGAPYAGTIPTPSPVYVVQAAGAATNGGTALVQFLPQPPPGAGSGAPAAQSGAAGGVRTGYTLGAGQTTLDYTPGLNARALDLVVVAAGNAAASVTILPRWHGPDGTLFEGDVAIVTAPLETLPLRFGRGGDYPLPETVEVTVIVQAGSSALVQWDEWGV